MAKKTRRGLSEDDKALWEQTASSVTRMEKGTLLHREAPKPTTPTVRKQPQPAPERPKLFQVGSKAKSAPGYMDTAPSLVEQFSKAPVQMDRKAFQNLKRGKKSPEARIDLHGMTLAQAHPALTRFIARAHGDGLRLVLVITGKGKNRDQGGPIPERFGALRHQVPEWLRQGAMAHVVMQITPAHVKHGGGGAYYVYLRRRR
ncbi:MAG: Smr/MutS family protein [Pseudomonadota bacterium]